MITEADLKEAIAECQGQRNPNASTCIKLAAFLTIQRELYGNQFEQTSYSFATEPVEKDGIKYDGDSDFAKIVFGKQEEFVFKIMDDLMSVLRATQPKLYDGVLRELQA